MHALGCECDFWQLKRSRHLLYQRAYSNLHNNKKRKKKDSRRAQNDTRPKTNRHSKGTCRAITKAAGGVLQFLTSTDETWHSFVQRQAADLWVAIDEKDIAKVQQLISHGGVQITMTDDSIKGSTVRPLHQQTLASAGRARCVDKGLCCQSLLQVITWR